MYVLIHCFWTLSLMKVLFCVVTNPQLLYWAPPFPIHHICILYSLSWQCISIYAVQGWYKYLYRVAVPNPSALWSQYNNYLDKKVLKRNCAVLIGMLNNIMIKSVVFMYQNYFPCLLFFPFWKCVYTLKYKMGHIEYSLWGGTWQ
jgi:hypothetical protein